MTENCFITMYTAARRNRGTGAAFRRRASPLLFGLALLVLSVPQCSAGDAGDLDAAPWTAVVDPAKQSLPGINIAEPIADIPPGVFAELAKMAEAGNPLAAVVMADHTLYELEDAEQAVRWLRIAVKNGDVDSAITLGKLYFPLEMAMGGKKFSHKPDAVLGYAWYAIGLSGVKMLEEKGGETRTGVRSAQNTVEGLRMMLLPSERVRAAAIISAWPKAMPPDAPLEAMPDADNEEDRETPENGGPLPDEDMIVERIRGYLAGKIQDANAAPLPSRPSPEFEQALQGAFEKIRRLAEAGDDEAELMAAWCRIHGVGTDVDAAAALAVIEAKAEAGHLEACFMAAVLALEQDDRDAGKKRAADMAARAAEKGHVRSMMVLSQLLRENGDREQAARWMEKAAEAGNFAAIQEMLAVAESARDWQKMIRWLTVLAIRAPNPEMSYRCRGLIAYVGSELDEDALQAAMADGEDWHTAHPVSNAH